MSSSNAPPPKMLFASLPDDILCMIFQRLPQTDILRLASSSKTLHAVFEANWSMINTHMHVTSGPNNQECLSQLATEVSRVQTLRWTGDVRLLPKFLDNINDLKKLKVDYSEPYQCRQCGSVAHLPGCFQFEFGGFRYWFCRTCYAEPLCYECFKPHRRNVSHETLVLSSNHPYHDPRQYFGSHTMIWSSHCWISWSRVFSSTNAGVSVFTSITPLPVSPRLINLIQVLAFPCLGSSHGDNRNPFLIVFHGFHLTTGSGLPRLITLSVLYLFMSSFDRFLGRFKNIP